MIHHEAVGQTQPRNSETSIRIHQKLLPGILIHKADPVHCSFHTPVIPRIAQQGSFQAAVKEKTVIKERLRVIARHTFSGECSSIDFKTISVILIVQQVIKHQGRCRLSEIPGGIHTCIDGMSLTEAQAHFRREHGPENSTGRGSRQRRIFPVVKTEFQIHVPQQLLSPEFQRHDRQTDRQTDKDKPSSHSTHISIIVHTGLNQHPYSKHAGLLVVENAPVHQCCFCNRCLNRCSLHLTAVLTLIISRISR